jgi:type IV pilus assembly protein PilA
MFSSTKNSSGFTLVELMVVVAIIGILSAIAVPNFKKYQAKSKQSEAKIQLAAVYSVEVSAQSDYDSFGTCLVDMGYDVPPKGFYMTGFATANAYLTGITGRGGACASAAYVIPGGGAAGTTVTTNYLKANAAATAAIQSDLNSATPTSSTFQGAATGQITSSITTFDKWTINESKSLSNTTVGY